MPIDPTPTISNTTPVIDDRHINDVPRCPLCGITLDFDLRTRDGNEQEPPKAWLKLTDRTLAHVSKEHAASVDTIKRILEEPVSPKKTLYIAGPITGVDDYEEHFNQAEQQLRAAGYRTLNPARTKLGDDASWEEYMHAGIKQILEADAIALLPRWQRSPGAMLETVVAANLGKPIESVGWWLNDGGGTGIELPEDRTARFVKGSYEVVIQPAGEDPTE